MKSAEQGTLLAPIGTVVVASLMFACSIFAFSAAGGNSQRSSTQISFNYIAVLCTFRGLIAIPTFVTSTGLDIWQIIASAEWFYGGIFISLIV